MKGIIALDLDGTLLGKNQIVSDKNKEAIQYAINKGYIVMVSTGRALANVNLDLLKQLNIEYVIHLNGARVTNITTGEAIYADPLEQKIAFEIFEQLPLEGVYNALYVDERAIVPLSGATEIYRLGFPASNIETFNRSVDYVEDPIEYVKGLGQQVYKISVDFEKNELYQKNKEKVISLFEKYPMAKGVSGGFDCIEFTAQNVSKGIALKKLAQRFGLDIKNCMAIGDSENDLDMIMTAGIGVAMGNGEAIVKEKADYITDDCYSDGVAKAIYKFI